MDEAGSGRTLRPEPGDVVRPASSANRPEPAARAEPRLPEEFGLVTHVRGELAQVYFPGLHGEVLVPAHRLARWKNPLNGALAPWLKRLHFVARLLQARSIVIEKTGDQGCGARFRHAELEITTLDRLRAVFGTQLRYLALLPGGQQEIEMALAFAAEAGDDAEFAVRAQECLDECWLDSAEALEPGSDRGPGID
jgi:hypothetical protein